MVLRVSDWAERAIQAGAAAAVCNGNRPATVGVLLLGAAVCNRRTAFEPHLGPVRQLQTAAPGYKPPLPVTNCRSLGLGSTKWVGRIIAAGFTHSE
jgi:hypothetical protein